GDLAAAAGGTSKDVGPRGAAGANSQVDTGSQPSLVGETLRLRRSFDDALAMADVPTCVTSLLELETALHDWAADTLQSDAPDRARRELRAMIVQLGELAEVGAAARADHPGTQVAPFVEQLLAIRAAARRAGDFTSSDSIRDQLTAAGVLVSDSTDGTRWELAPPGDPVP
ncbi:MAG TPA: hypothetical protein VMT27_03885, partial [Actinomycetes bacterium]|nr:hypothetical protein [Actinomycetes bacterium]